MPKQRLDQLLVARGLATSRSRAQQLISQGCVTSQGGTLTKPGQQLDEDVVLEVAQDHPWVSRGGIKLAHALDVFHLSPKSMVALDVGASTGGFTDVLLQQGAQKIYAVDVGHDQLATSLRDHPQVVNLEGVNARYLNEDHCPEPVDLVVCDASFISLTKLLSASLALTRPRAQLIALIKPQFEVGKGRLGKGGVVRDPALHEEVCETVLSWLAESCPTWHSKKIIESPITGPDGNKEFLLYAQKGN